MKDKDIKYLSAGVRLQFDSDGFAINPFDEGNAFFVGDWRDIIIGLAGSGQIIVHGSHQRLPPNFKTASSISNFHVPITLADLSIANTYYSGTTGVSVAASSALVEVNTNLLTWVAIERKSQAVNVKLTVTNAQ